jgi:SAM-dependent methyltransferase
MNAVVEFPRSGGFSQYLRCPDCRAALHNDMTCSRCGEKYTKTRGKMDLRLHHPKTMTVQFEVGTALNPIAFTPLEPRPTDIQWRGKTWPLDADLLTHIPRAQPGYRMLDLGCGTGLHQGVAEHAGYEWVGIDYDDASGGQILADAHSLPFEDNSFDCILSMAVMEHIRYPHVVAQEALRVLKPGCLFIGTVSFMEPWHGDSYYHHSCLGTYTTMKSAGFELVAVAPSVVWHALKAQAQMSLFQKMPMPLSAAIVWPAYALHRIWWKLGSLVNAKATEQQRANETTAAFTFIARKP